MTSIVLDLGRHEAAMGAFPPWPSGAIGVRANDAARRARLEDLEQERAFDRAVSEGWPDRTRPALRSIDPKGFRMSERTLLTTISFRRSFFLRGAGGALPPGSYAIETVEALIEGLSFEAYRRVATMIFLPAGSTPGNAAQMATIDPTELSDAHRRDGLD